MRCELRESALITSLVPGIQQEPILQDERCGVLDSSYSLHASMITTYFVFQEYSRPSAYKKSSLVVLAALHEVEDYAAPKRLTLPNYMRDKSMGIFVPTHKARVLGSKVIHHRGYNIASLAIIVVSIIAVVWTPNSSQEGPDTKVSPGFLKSKHWSSNLKFKPHSFHSRPAAGTLYRWNSRYLGHSLLGSSNFTTCFTKLLWCVL